MALSLYIIAESRRDALGRGSRVLRRLLSSAEVELVIRSEQGCVANQLRPELVLASVGLMFHFYPCFM